ncbi:MAG TPA: diphthine--ammonia ligase [Candidatus Poseidoniaceae archaeon]|nr:MAG TPA: diphthine--ammonia ligase [Candidatus Poseidoniales archaeon]HIH52714.1 diphthine--ammonia ligase [Candidatus Poseidoniaceae archaeon]
MRVAVLSSGGKDSCAAWWWATCRGWDVTVIVTLVVEGDSPMFQVPNTLLAREQAAAAGVAWDHRVIDGEEGPDFEALESMLIKHDLDGFVSGALRSDYQRNRLERLGEKLGLRTWTPLWHQRPIDHLRGLAAHGFDVLVTSVSAEGLDEAWLGRTLDAKALDELEALSKVHRFNVDGEGGEYETLVLRAPMFPEGLDLSWTSVWDGRRGHLVVN